MSTMLCQIIFATAALAAVAPVEGGGWLGRAAVAASDAAAAASDAAAARSDATRGRFLRAVGRRTLQDGADGDACLGAFAACEADTLGCLACLLEILEVEDDDGGTTSGSAPGDSCGSVLDFLHSIKTCEWLETQDAAAPAVCTVWEACAEDLVDGAASARPAPAPVECATDACDVAHAAWLGDGACDDSNGCYNTAACGWDGGDCCASTCRDGAAFACGSEAPFRCKDPDAQGCGARAQAAIELEGGAGGYEYSLWSVILGSFALVSGGEFDGEPSTTDACLADGCYVVEVTGDATLSDAPRWAVKTRDAVSSAMDVAASGGGPSVCTFPVGRGAERYCPAGCVEERAPKCDDDDQFVMILHDAGFNGWGAIGYSVHAHDSGGERGEAVREGTLALGHMGVEPLCIPEPGCYSVTLAEGWWSDEVSWSLGRRGHGIVAEGGAPAQCDFSVGGDFCADTCAPGAPGGESAGCDPDDATAELYTMEMYDAYGDGWNGVEYAISGDDGAAITGSLRGGFQGEDELCLKPGCYDFHFPAWSSERDEAAWALGAPGGGVVFSGMPPADCVFAVGGGECPTGAHTKSRCGFDGGSLTPPPTSVFACGADEALAVMRLAVLESITGRRPAWDIFKPLYLASNSFSMILEPLILASRVLDDCKKTFGNSFRKHSS